MKIATLYIGTVTRVVGNKIYVIVPDIAQNLEIGALQMVTPHDPAIVVNTVGLITDSGTFTTAHTHNVASHTHTVTNPYYSKGDRVVVGQYGTIKDQLIVMGRIL